MTTDKIDLKNFNREQLQQWISSLGHSPYRARQIFAWLYRPGITDFQQMTDLPKQFRDELQETAYISFLPIAAQEVSTDGTIKYGLQLHDGLLIESVLIPEEERNTLCISSQVGCAMGCAFCLTGTMGFSRNLTPAEIVGQISAIQRDLSQRQAGRITNIVFMGMGEPLANFDNLLTALAIIMDELGLHFANRSITVSTCGLAPKIVELGKRFRVNLAISLHGADDETRNKIMPVNLTYPIAEVLEACRQFPLPSGKVLMFEYILLAGINDSVDDAQKLAALLKGVPCKINLLPCNEAPEIPFSRPSRNRVYAFQDVLRKAGYTVLIRTSRGADISAACGQLANKSRQEQKGA
ncbi:MAG: 23S rRNA (adenine(2503)-C(2))-methyltransferase RlmN [Desulfurivibrionaceae bacterium]|nr:23S rRNA (adenine(2503)-C(2))-methyltransferase RlmN [Desulfurivibrionaceae bacterium]